MFGTSPKVLTDLHNCVLTLYIDECPQLGMSSVCVCVWNDPKSNKNSKYIFFSPLFQQQLAPDLSQLSVEESDRPQVGTSL